MLMKWIIHQATMICSQKETINPVFQIWNLSKLKKAIFKKNLSVLLNKVFNTTTTTARYMNIQIITCGILSILF